MMGPVDAGGRGGGASIASGANSSFARVQGSFVSSVKGKIAWTGAGVCMMGQVLQWSQVYGTWCKGIAEEMTDGECRRYALSESTYSLFLVLLAWVNVYSHVGMRPELVWISATLMFVVLNRNVCAAKYAHEGGEHVLLVSIVLCIVGSVATFAVVRTDKARTEQPWYIAAFTLVVTVLLLIGSLVAFYNTDSPCPETQALTLSVWYFISVWTDYVAGQELTFLYAAAVLPDYNPLVAGGTYRTPCFFGLLFLVLFHLLVDCVDVHPGFDGSVKLTRRLCVSAACAVAAVTGCIVLAASPLATGEQRFGAGVMAVVACFMILVGITKSPGLAVLCLSLQTAAMYPMTVGINAPQAGPQERVAYILLFLGSILSFLGLPCKWDVHAAAEVVHPAVVPRFDTTTAPTPSVGAKGVGSGSADPPPPAKCVTFARVSPPVERGRGVEEAAAAAPTAEAADAESLASTQPMSVGKSAGIRAGADAPTTGSPHEGRDAARGYVQSAVAILCSVGFLWSNGAYEGGMGFVALVLLVSATQDFPHGVNWCYFASWLFIPRLTPFTASRPYTVHDYYSGTEKIAVMLCLFAFLNVIAQHTQAFNEGGEAFRGHRLFSRTRVEATPQQPLRGSMASTALYGGVGGDAAGDGSDAGDAAHRPSSWYVRENKALPSTYAAGPHGTYAAPHADPIWGGLQRGTVRPDAPARHDVVDVDVAE